MIQSSMLMGYFSKKKNMLSFLIYNLGLISERFEFLMSLIGEYNFYTNKQRFSEKFHRR